MKKIAYLLMVITLCCTACTAESSKESRPQANEQNVSAQAVTSVPDTTAVSTQDTKVVPDSATSVQEGKVNNDTVSKDTINKNVVATKTKQNGIDEKNGKSFNFHDILIYVAYALLLILSITVYVLGRKIRDIDYYFGDWKKSVTDLSSRVKELERKVNVANGNSSGWQLPSNSISKEVKNPSKTIQNASAEVVTPQEIEVQPVSKSPSESPKSVVVYLKNFKNGEMRECTKQESQYELHLNREDDSVGEFYFAGNPATAIATKDSTFAGVCDYDNWNTNSKTCHSVEKGRAQKISDGKWEATKKARVKCE